MQTQERTLKIPQEIREIVANGPLVHLTTLNQDGSPQVSVVWAGIVENVGDREDEFVFAHMLEHQKVRNVRRDDRVALSFMGNGKNDMGLDEYVVVYGRATITEGGAAGLLQELAHIYLGPDVAFPPQSVRDRPGYITHVRPERITGVGPWSVPGPPGNAKR